MGALWQKRWRAASRLRQAVGRALAPEAIVPPVPFEVAVERRRVEVVGHFKSIERISAAAQQFRVAVYLAVERPDDLAALVAPRADAERERAVAVFAGMALESCIHVSPDEMGWPVPRFGGRADAQRLRRI